MILVTPVFFAHLYSLKGQGGINEDPFLKFPASKTLEIGPNYSLFLSLVCDPDRLKGSLS
jgi:hypothetical protein